ncbi:MAG: RNA 2',3'-cyclic phosphodiesterase [Blastocatellia bacterium]|nr:MAG: RNA 2',3'-cyclic phosphodiesterase [Blastocatellia bacterium]
MRLFVAIELNDETRQAISAEQNRLQEKLGTPASGRTEGLRWVRPEHMHLTLAFLGEIATDRVQTIVEVMQQPIDVEPFSIVFGGLATFPAHGAPRVAWLGLTSGAADVAAVHRHVTRRLEGVGIAPESRSFHPHLTLGRWRASTAADQRRILAAGRSDKIGHVVVETVTLIHSRLSPAGPTYAPLCEARLRDPTSVPLQSD